LKNTSCQQTPWRKEERIGVGERLVDRNKAGSKQCGILAELNESARRKKGNHQNFSDSEGLRRDKCGVFQEVVTRCPLQEHRSREERWPMSLRWEESWEVSSTPTKLRKTPRDMKEETTEGQPTFRGRPPEQNKTGKNWSGTACQGRRPERKSCKITHPCKQSGGPGSEKLSEEGGLSGDWEAAAVRRKESDGSRAEGKEVINPTQFLGLRGQDLGVGKKRFLGGM